MVTVIPSEVSVDTAVVMQTSVFTPQQGVWQNCLCDSPNHPQTLEDPKRIIKTVLANNEERNKPPEVKLVLILRLRN